MSYSERLSIYKQIEAKRKRPLISYITSSRPGTSAQMAPDVIPEFANHILSVPADKKEIDLLIVSNGGDPTVAWRMISMLRERFERIGVLLPYAAFSAATLLSLGADEIVMHPFANLGPVDPQLSYSRRTPGKEGPQNTEAIKFSPEDLKHFLEFARHDVGISDQAQLGKTLELLCNEVSPLPIGAAKRSTHLSESMGEKLLSLHMADPNKAKTIAESLNSSFYHHGYPVGRKEAKEIGLTILDSDTEIENLIWSAWKNTEAEMQCNKPFSIMEILKNSSEAPKLFGPVPQANIPSNLPPQLMQQIYNNIVAQASQIVPVNPIDYELILSTVESIYGRSAYIVEGKITAVRLPNMQFQISNTVTSNWWTFSDNEYKNEEASANEHTEI